MATVIVNGNLEIQDEYTKLQDLRESYPGCWLVDSDNETSAHRTSAFTLTNGKSYILIRIYST
jgi:hypothetical protein